MKKLFIPIAIVSLVAFLGLGLMGVIWGFSVYNAQASNQNLYEMKVKDNSSEFDNMWKEISQVCQLADSKKDAFKEIFTSYAEASIPPAVIAVFNELIVANLQGGEATVKQNTVVNRIAQELGITRQAVFDNHYLDVETLFRKAGWKVEYDKPAYNETYEATFKFRK